MDKLYDVRQLSKGPNSNSIVTTGKRFIFSFSLECNNLHISRIDTYTRTNLTHIIEFDCWMRLYMAILPLCDEHADHQEFILCGGSESRKYVDLSLRFTT
jgi:hypothetical protein